MKKYAILLFIFGIGFTCHSQYDCGWYSTLTIEQRNAQFPFNKAKKILIVSYANKEYETGVKPGFTVEEASAKFHKDILHKRVVTTDKGNSLTYFTSEEVELKSDAVNSLSNLLLNYTTKEQPEEEYSLAEYAFCYEPRNAVLFFDENDTIIACIELCFQCRRMNVYPETDYNFYLDVAGCEQKLDLLRELFKDNGINYGITDRR